MHGIVCGQDFHMRRKRRIAWNRCGRKRIAAIERLPPKGGDAETLSSLDVKCHCGSVEYSRDGRRCGEMEMRQKYGCRRGHGFPDSLWFAYRHTPARQIATAQTPYAADARRAAYRHVGGARHIRAPGRGAKPDKPLRTGGRCVHPPRQAAAPRPVCGHS